MRDARRWEGGTAAKDGITLRFLMRLCFGLGTKTSEQRGRHALCFLGSSEEAAAYTNTLSTMQTSSSEDAAGVERADGSAPDPSTHTLLSGAVKQPTAQL